MIRRNIPNFITCMNLFSGCLGIYFLSIGELELGCYMVFAGAILDFFDGFAARILKVTSPIGKQLDSLADMVTFGVLPGMILSVMLKISTGIYTIQGTSLEPIVVVSGFIITVFSGVRLAKFNIDTRQTDSFIGLPTPANSIFFASLLLIMKLNYPQVNELLLNLYFLLFLNLVMSYLLIAELPLFALKFKSFAWRGNEIRYLFLVNALILIAIFQIVAIPIIVLLYIVFSLFQNILTRKKVI